MSGMKELQSIEVTASSGLHKKATMKCRERRSSSPVPRGCATCKRQPGCGVDSRHQEGATSRLREGRKTQHPVIAFSTPTGTDEVDPDPGQRKTRSGRPRCSPHDRDAVARLIARWVVRAGVAAQREGRRRGKVGV